MSFPYRIFAFLCCISAGLGVAGQNCEWLETIHKMGAHQIYTDDSNNVIVAGYLDTSLMGKQAGYIVKYTSSGNLVWVAPSNGIATSGQNTCAYHDISGDLSGNYYLSGSAIGAFDFGNGVVIANGSNEDAHFLLKVNNNGIAQWVREFKSNQSVSFRLAVINDKNGDVYIGGDFHDSLHYSGSGTPLITAGNVNSSDIFLIKYTPAGNLVWGRKYGGMNSQHLARNIAVDSFNNLYTAGFTTADNWTFGSSTLSSGARKLMVLKFDSNGDPVKGMLLDGDGGFAAISAFPDGRVVLAGQFSGSMYLSPSITLNNVGAVRVGNIVAWNAYVAMLDTGLVCQWAIQDYPTYSQAFRIVAKPIVQNNSIYIGGFVYDSTYFANTLIRSNARIGFSNYPPEAPVMAKLDTLGNLLWAFSSADNTYSVQVSGAAVDKEGNGYFCGVWKDTVQVFNYSDIYHWGEFNAFTARISDYNIERGPVYPGPYCAGDSIDIPYTAKGPYDPSNEFVAQLSDSAGNFESSFRELGRITGTHDGVIKGVLPFFNVSTGGNYRIRIVSTGPEVQSFYIRDTLRLLIYSKDSANAGEDRSVCQGQTTLLQTTGGSKWHWSPTYDFIDPADSAKATGTVLPDADTEYRVIISDSSGCGVTDTDYVHIHVRPPIDVAIPTTVKKCPLRDAVIPAEGTGGDTSNYHFTWWQDGFPETILSSQSVLSVAPFGIRRYWVKLTDSCSNNSDSALVIVSISSGVTLDEVKDTTLCPGQSVGYTITSVACDSTAIKYYWDNGLGTGATKTLAPLTTTDYRVIARDTVDGRADTVSFRVTVLPLLKANLGNDTILCEGQNLLLSPIYSGGNGDYRYTWLADTGTGFYSVDTSATLLATPSQKTYYRVVLSDGCTSPSDSAEMSIDLFDELAIKTLPDTLVCKGEKLNLWSNVSGGNPGKGLVSWYDEDLNLIDTGLSVTVSPLKGTSLMAVLDDKCSLTPDTSFVRVDVRDGLSIAPLNDTSICFGADINLSPTLSGGLPSGYLLYLHSALAVDSGFVYTLKPDTFSSYTLVLKDGCSADSASISFDVHVSEPLTVLLQMEDSLCAGSVLDLNTVISGGLPVSNQLSWYRNDSLQTASSSKWSDQPLMPSWYKVRVEDGCSDAAFDSAFVTVLPMPVAQFLLSDTLGCSPLNLLLTDISQNHEPLFNKWEVSGSGFASDEPNLMLVQPGTYSISLTVFNNLNCSDKLIQNQRVRVNPKPRAGFEVFPLARQTENELRFVNSGSGGSFYHWNLGDGSLFSSTEETLLYTYEDSGFYTVSQIVENDLGCTDTFEYPMRVYLSPLCAIPNAFTPTGNGLNEVFAPQCSGISSYKLAITNRWGEIMLNCENCAWDGTYEGKPVPPGVYFYRIDMYSPVSGTTNAVGPVHVLR